SHAHRSSADALKAGQQLRGIRGRSSSSSSFGRPASSSPVPPVIRGPAFSDMHSAGLYHGAAARSFIHAWAKSAEIVALLQFVSSGPGQEALQAMQRDNTKAFPQLAQNIKGIAEGAQ